MPTEYDFIDIIGNTYESSSIEGTQKIGFFHHKKQVDTVSLMLKKMNFSNYDKVIDLGCSNGGWFDDYKKMNFRKIIGIDISKERVNQAKIRGCDETYVCNAYELPFDNDSESCVISNGMFVHVLRDSDKLRILNEVYRVLRKNGIFIFDFTNPNPYGFNEDATKEYCRFCTLETITSLINKTKLRKEYVMPGYFLVPKIGTHRYLTSLFVKLVFPITDSILRKSNNLRRATTIYLGLRKIV